MMPAHGTSVAIPNRVGVPSQAMRITQASGTPGQSFGG